jgi:anaerobic ribonucleoside-triphosphate reductase activating protein
MNYHNITCDDMLNGAGLRVVLWVAGCKHHCKGCQNPVTWNPRSGIPFDDNAKEEIFEALKNKYISGITLSGGDPLHVKNVYSIYKLIKEIKSKFPDKTIWIYTGYTWEQIQKKVLLKATVELADVLVDGRFEQELASVNYHWAGSTNQRVIDVQESIKKGQVVLYERSV